MAIMDILNPEAEKTEEGKPTEPKIKFRRAYDYHTKRCFWWSMRDKNGRCAEIRINDRDTLNLYICDFYKSTHSTLQEAMDEAQKYVGDTQQ